MKTNGKTWLRFTLAMAALVLAVSLGVILRRPAIAGERTVTVFLNGSYDGDRVGDLGSETNPYEALGDIRYNALNGTGPFTQISSLDRIIIRVTGDSRNGHSLNARNGVIGGSGGLDRVITQDPAHNTYYSGTSPVAGVNDSAKRVMMDLRGEQIGLDGDDNPVYPTIYYNASSTYLLQVDDYTYSNLSFKQLRWNWDDAEDPDVKLATLGVADPALDHSNVNTLYVCADKCIIGENVHFYGSLVTGSGASTRVEDVEKIHFRGGFVNNYLNGSRLAVNGIATPKASAVTAEEMAAFAETTSSDTDRYSFSRGRAVTITGGTWGTVQLLGQARHAYTSGASIELNVTGAECDVLWLAGGGAEFLPGPGGGLPSGHAYTGGLSARIPRLPQQGTFRGSQEGGGRRGGRILQPRHGDGLNAGGKEHVGAA